jgi:lysophospholipase L1-like esterase
MRVWRSALLAARGTFTMRALISLFLVMGMTTAAAGKRYLALGDSYTIGESVAESGRFPVQLAARLNEQGHDYAAPEIIARTGWTTADLQAAIDLAKPRPPYDLVTLLIGVNNQYRGGDLRRYRSEFARLLVHAIALAGRDKRQVLVVSIPDWGVTPFARNDKRGSRRIGKQIDAFNAEARDVCHKNGVRFIDITPTSRERGGDTDMLAPDGLHPSAAMYARWVDVMLHDAFTAK